MTPSFLRTSNLLSLWQKIGTVMCLHLEADPSTSRAKTPPQKYGSGKSISSGLQHRPGANDISCSKKSLHHPLHLVLHEE